MHLKKFSLQVVDGTVSLSPAYDLLNSTLVLEVAVAETALSLDGKKRQLTGKLGLDYFCRQRLGLSTTVIDDILADLAAAVPQWRRLIECCYLSAPKKVAYLDLFDERLKRLARGRFLMRLSPPINS